MSRNATWLLAACLVAGVIGLLLSGLLFPVWIYVVLQIAAFLRLKRFWRIAALLPIPPMIYAAAVTISAYRAESNIWPIVLIYVSILAIVYLSLLLGFVILRTGRREGP